MAKGKKRCPRATQPDLTGRIDFVRRLIGRCYIISTIKRKVRERYGDLDHRTILGYIARARIAIQADVGKGRQRLRTEIGEFYRSHLGDEAIKPETQLKAADGFVNLHGLARPAAQMVNLTGSGEGGAVKLESKSTVTHDGKIGLSPTSLAAFLADVAAASDRDVPPDGDA